MNNPNPFDASAGWKCARCGGFVPHGVTHACPVSSQPWPTPLFLSQATGLAVPWVTLLPLLERLVVALEKITDKAAGGSDG
jgi:hypothetical protein